MFAGGDASGMHPRAAIALALVNTWGMRLLHNYFRREGWHFGLGEDWRYADMRRQHGMAWIVVQFFAVCVAQHGMLVGLTLPLQAAMAADGNPLGALDVRLPSIMARNARVAGTAAHTAEERVLPQHAICFARAA